MAHPYTTDSNERETVPLYLAGAAIASAIGLNWLFKTLNWSPPAWIDAPSTVAFYGLYYQMFRIWIWRWSILHRIGIVRLPDLSGEWDGHVVTTHDEQHRKHAVHVTIQQNWTHMHIMLRSSHSLSHSLIGAIMTQDGATLTYEYFNEPLPNATETMHAHKGAARLVFSNNRDSLDGDYYTGRDRTNYGALSLNRS